MKAAAVCCGTCRHFIGQRFGKRAGWKRAPGKCAWPYPIPTLPDVIAKGHDRRALMEPNRLAAWPDDGETCPTWEPAP